MLLRDLESKMTVSGPRWQSRRLPLSAPQQCMLHASQTHTLRGAALSPGSLNRSKTRRSVCQIARSTMRRLRTTSNNGCRSIKNYALQVASSSVRSRKVNMDISIRGLRWTVSSAGFGAEQETCNPFRCSRKYAILNHSPNLKWICETLPMWRHPPLSIRLTEPALTVCVVPSTKLMPLRCVRGCSDRWHQGWPAIFRLRPSLPCPMRRSGLEWCEERTVQAKLQCTPTFLHCQPA